MPWQRGRVLYFRRSGCGVERLNGPCTPKSALYQGLLDSLETKMHPKFSVVPNEVGDLIRAQREPSLALFKS